MNTKKLLAIFVLMTLSLSACGAFTPRLISTDTGANDITPSISEAPASIAVDTLEINIDALTLTPGQIGQLKVTANLSNGSRYSNLTNSLVTPYDLNTDVKWFSNDESVVTVDDAGKLTAVAAGSTTVKGSIYNQSVIATITVAEANDALVSFTFHQTYTQTSSAQNLTLTFDAEFALTGAATNLSATVLAEHASCDLQLSTSDSSVATVSTDAILTPLANGNTTFTADCNGVAATFPLTIMGFAESASAPIADESQSTTVVSDDELQPEAPTDDSEYFLGADDTITLTVGTNGGFGSANLPDVVYGTPVSSRTDVVSLGEGGEILIELGDYGIVDGPGVDFTVFENAFTGWVEPGIVSVSDDGVTFAEFPCDAFATDGIYSGCAGITPVNYSSNDADYLDPSLSGGDSFDLADVGLTQVKYIKITDANTCTNPIVCVPSTAGFDLDAVAILNGVNF